MSSLLHGSKVLTMGMLWEAPQSIKELGNLCKEVSKPGIVNILIHLQLNLQQTVHS